MGIATTMSTFAQILCLKSDDFHFPFLLHFPFHSHFQLVLPFSVSSPFPIKFSSGNCFRYWRNPGWNSALNCIKHQFYCAVALSKYCTGLQLQCRVNHSKSQSIALHCDLIGRTLGGSGWKSAGARRILNFGFWPQSPLFLWIRNAGMACLGDDGPGPPYFWVSAALA